MSVDFDFGSRSPSEASRGEFRVPVGMTLLAALFTFGTTAALVASSGCNGASGGPNAKFSPSPSPPAPSGWSVSMFAPGRNAAGFQVQTAISNLTRIPAGKTSTVPAVIETAYSTLNDGTAPFLSTKRILALNGVLTQIQDEGSQSLVDPNELSSFIVAAHTQIPNAAKNCLVIMGPGGFPLLGVGADAGAGNLDLASFDSALATGLTNAGLTKFDLVILDLPESASAEMISVVRKHASFVVACESGASTVGFDYAGLATALADGASPDASTLTATVLGGFLTNAQAHAKDQVQELIDTSVDLSKGGSLMTAINAFGAALTADLTTTATTLPSVVAAIGSCRANCVAIDVHAKTNLVDLATFASALATVNTSTTTAIISSGLVTACNALVTEITGDVQTGTVGSFYTGAKGLAIYFPHCARDSNSNYSVSAAAFLNDAPQWLTFLTTYFNALTNGAVSPSVFSLTVPSAITQGSPYSVSGTIFPNNAIHNVTLLVTQSQGGQNVVLSRLDLGVPDAQTGNIAAAPFMVFCAASAGTDGPFFFPLARNTNGSAPVFFGVDCDQEYTTATGTVTLPGFVKAADIAGVGSSIAWQAFEQNGALARNDFALVPQAGVVYTLFPRTVVVDSSGKISSVTQSVDALRSTSGALVISPSQLLNQTLPVGATIWLVAESFNGDLATASVNVTIQ